MNTVSRPLRACILPYSALFFVLFFFIQPVHAGSVNLAWDPVVTTALAGYKVHYGTQSGTYTTSVDVGNVVSCQVTGLTAGATYYFTVTAYGTSGQESPYSNEILTTIELVGGSVQLQTSSRADDSHEKTSDGTNVPYQSTSYVGSGRINGFRFQGVRIPPYAIIKEAHLWLNCRGYNKKSISICYTGEMTAGALPFTAARYNISSRPRTSAEVTDRPSSWVTGAYNASPDLSAIIQEIIDQPEWQEGNALAIFILDRQSTSDREINNYDRNPDLSAKLTITYYQP
jgi:hypothetical protein